jgi:phosphoglycolate phosphatase
VLIFDLDGTLFQSASVTIPAVRQALKEFGLPPVEEPAIQAFFGRPNVEFQHWLNGLASDGTARLARRVSELELEFVPGGRLYPGVRLALDAAQAEYAPLVLCSNGTRPYIELVLECHGLAKYFSRVRFPRAAEDSKPAMVRELINQFGALHTIVIGDRQDDIEAARTNGVRAIGAAYGYGSAAELTGADAVAATPAELPDLIERLMAS